MSRIFRVWNFWRKWRCEGVLNFHWVLFSPFQGLLIKTYCRVYFSLCLFLAISGRSELNWKFNHTTKIPDIRNLEFTVKGKWKHTLHWFYFQMSFQGSQFFEGFMFWCNFNWSIYFLPWSFRLVNVMSRVRIPLWVRIFHFVILGSRSSQFEKAHANIVNHGILRANTLF